MLWDGRLLLVLRDGLRPRLRTDVLAVHVELSAVRESVHAVLLAVPDPVRRSTVWLVRWTGNVWRRTTDAPDGVAHTSPSWTVQSVRLLLIVFPSSKQQTEVGLNLCSRRETQS